MRLAFLVAGAWLALGCGGSTDSDPSGTGGASTGGASTGGTPGAGGVPGTGAVAGGGGTPSTGGATGIGPECTADSECTLFADCCTCTAYGPGEEPPPSCFADCVQSACDTLGVNAASVQCVAGRCVPGIQCQPTQVFCNALPPECEQGQAPSVVNGCWGSCVPATDCASVPSCDECDAPLTTCVTVDFSGGDGTSQHCVSVPKGCEGNPTCSCMAANVCVSPTSECVDLSGIKGMACGCAACD